jgi:hypothetical protein
MPSDERIECRGRNERSSRGRIAIVVRYTKREVQRRFIEARDIGRPQEKCAGLRPKAIGMKMEELNEN